MMCVTLEVPRVVQPPLPLTLLEPIQTQEREPSVFKNSSNPCKEIVRDEVVYLSEESLFSDQVSEEESLGLLQEEEEQSVIP